MSFFPTVTRTSSTPPLRQQIDICQHWQFLRLEDVPPLPETTPTSVIPGLSGNNWETVSLPHTPKIEAAAVQLHFQGVCWYQKRVSANPAWHGKNVFLEFGAGMQIAEVWVEGEYRLRHLGGYLPFGVDLSDTLGKSRDVHIAVRLDNRDTEECPPGKPLAGMDFSYFGGLYRGACLHITNPLHVSDAVRAGQEAGGGVFVRCENASKASATVHVKTHVFNASPIPLRKCQVVSEVYAPSGELLQTATSFSLMIAAGEGHHFVQEIELLQPALWHPDHPHLHTLVTRVLQWDKPTDEITTRFGLRHVALTNRFMLNGSEFTIRGTNRHQEYPYIGNAVPKNAQRRDARLIKDAGFNFVRLSHYPQDPSFLDACDELGLLVQAAVPGWQQFWLNPSFVSQSFKDIRELIRRDRNHASIVIWEPNLNETGVGESGEGFHDWCRAAHEITHLEYPGTQCLTFGDDYPAKPGWTWDVTGLWREYGDFAFGGNESTSRHTRGEGEKAMLQQTWNYLWTLNHLNANLDNPETVYRGCAVWVMFDYNRGYYHLPCNCGMMDIFRLPKYVWYFYQSQRDPRLLRTDVASGPMVFIASDWSHRSGMTKVVVFSNADEVEVLLNGRVLARRTPDTGPDTEYSERKETNLATVGDDYDRSGGNPFDGGNARHIPHPPFTFNQVPYEAGRLEAHAYLDGQLVAKHAVTTAGEPEHLDLVINTAGVPLATDSMDVVFLHARLTDAIGTVVSEARIPIHFEAEGAELIGANPVTAEAGIASILLKTTGSLADVRIRAKTTAGIPRLVATRDLIDFNPGS